MRHGNTAIVVLLVALGVVAAAGVAHALSCEEPHEELVLEIDAVEVDGVPQSDLTPYSTRTAFLWVVPQGDREPGYGFIELRVLEDGTFIYSENYDAPSDHDR